LDLASGPLCPLGLQFSLRYRTEAATSQLVRERDSWMAYGTYLKFISVKIEIYAKYCIKNEQF